MHQTIGAKVNEIGVRLADPIDSRALFSWRNDELTREMSHSGEIVTWKAHSIWFSNALTNTECCLVMCYLQTTKERVGTVRFNTTTDRETAMVSINLDPAMRGRGLAKKCLQQSLAFFTGVSPEVSQVNAEIKHENLASRRSFEGVGFTLQEEVNGVIFLALKLD